jgi:hypothetical protein
MDTKALASGIVGFLLGGLVVSVAATLEEPADPAEPPAHGLPAVHQTTTGLR